MQSHAKALGMCQEVLKRKDGFKNTKINHFIHKNIL